MRMKGADIIANSVKSLNVDVVFGIVGIPVIEIAESLQSLGVRFIGFRNEQAASYAASAYGFLTGRPGICLVVGGPGVLHAMAGVGNASANGWPLLLLAGSSESHQRNKGAFQELDQISLLAPHTKLATRPSSCYDVSQCIERAYRAAHYGRPGPTYVDLPADLIQGDAKDAVEFLHQPHLPSRNPAHPSRIEQVARLLRNAKAPLIVIGKGAAYAQAEVAMRELIERTNIPFLPTPMGKGVIADSHPSNTASARSTALKQTDVVIVFGARLNWILHYGEPPRWARNPTIVQVDIAAEELGQNGGSSEYALQGDAGMVAKQLTASLGGWTYNTSSSYIQDLKASKEKNANAAAAKMQSDALPMSYQRVYAEISRAIKDMDVVFVSEGANTMDVARSAFNVELPRHRLDAGTHATMGVGMGYAIAAAIAYPGKKIIAIEGDSAFGFSAMELETAARNKLPMVVFVMNNNGVYHGLDEADYLNRTGPLPSTALSYETRYDLIAQGCGAKGFVVRTPEELQRATRDALQNDGPSLVNVLMDPGSKTKLEFGWLSSTNAKL